MPSKQKAEERKIIFLDFELFIGGYANVAQRQSSGFVNRSTNQDNPLQEQHLKTCDKNDLACFLAFFFQKDPDLAVVVERWPGLPEHIKQTIKTIIESSK